MTKVSLILQAGKLYDILSSGGYFIESLLSLQLHYLMYLNLTQVTSHPVTVVNSVAQSYSRKNVDLIGCCSSDSAILEFKLAFNTIEDYRTEPFQQKTPRQLAGPSKMNITQC